MRKINKLHQDIEYWDKKYDGDIEEMDRKIGHLTGDRDIQLVNLEELRARWQVEQDAERELREEANLKAENAKNEKALLKRQNIAAKVLQRELRGYLKRKAEFEALNPKKGGKGGKKGGKKKK